jgi:hypothetical protein
MNFAKWKADIKMILAIIDQDHSFIPSVRTSLLNPESASRSLVDFSVLNDNLIKGLILYVKCISMF